MNIVKMILPVLSAAAFTLSAASTELKTIGGRSSLEIVAAPQTDPTAKYAAAELRKYLGKITGIDVLVLAGPGKCENRIMLCLPESPYAGTVRELFPNDVKALKGTDGSAVRQRGNTIYLMADCPKGLLTGVYRFLMKNTNIIWPRPAGGLAIFTPSENLTFKATDYLDLPKFKYRGWGWNYSRTVWSDELDEWRARMGFNRPGGPHTKRNAVRERRLGFIGGYYTDGISGGHNMISHWLPTELFGKEHPDYYMLIDGKRYVKRNANPCYTHPEVADVIAKRVIAEIDAMKKKPSVMIIQNSDQGFTCECPECVKPIELADGSLLKKDDEAFRSTQFFIFFNKIARQVGAKYPDVLLQTYGYFFTAIPPKVKLEPNIAIAYCPYIRNDKEPLSGPSNQRWWKRTNGWLALTPNLMLREYYYSGAAFPRPLPEIMGQDLRYLQKHGIPSVTSEFTWSDDDFKPRSGLKCSLFWDLAACEVWIMSQLIWNPYQDVTKLRDDFLDRTYREGAPGMREFYRLIREAWLNDPKPSAFNDDIVKSFNYYVLGKKIDKKCLASLDGALKSVRHPESRKLIEKARDTFKFHLAAAKAESTTELNVPKLKCTDYPGFDLESGIWSKAAVFPALKRLNNRTADSTFPMTLKVFHDGRNLYLGTFVKKDPKTLNARLFKVKDASFPSGDHAEFFFVNRKDKYYYHLAWDYLGSLYDAKLTDSKWNGPWEVRVQTGPDGWRSVAKIPLETLGMTLLESNKLSSLLMITAANPQGRNEASTWGGGKVHSPDSFGELIFALE